MTALLVDSTGALTRFSPPARMLAPPPRKGYNGAVEFRILGPIEVWQDDHPVKLGGAKLRSLLGALLLRSNEVVSSDRLIEELWGERAPATATKLIHGYVAELRRTLGAEAILTRSSGYVLPVAEEKLDALQFARLAREAQALPPDSAAQALRNGLALWRGPALSDVPLQGLTRHEAERLNELRLEALAARVDADLACGRHQELVAELEALIAEHPLRERLRAQLMLALYRSGRQAEALRVYSETRHALAGELGLDPSRELRALEQAILTQDPALGAPAAPAKRPATRLPIPPTPLIGRTRELAEAGALLREHRLVTLTGPGGAGKTRLALELAHQAVPDSPDGVYWVSLQTLRDPELVVPAIENAVGGGELAAQLRDRRLVLVLDNFEQLRPAAPKLADLLAAIPHVKLLVTSRQRLRLSAEHEYPVAPLLEQEAVELFNERARAAKPDFEVDGAVAPLCRRLDCLPLALELAAARVKALEPAALLDRLGQRLPLLIGGPTDAPARQQTMRATIEWSHALLDQHSKELFARLAVFAGGCTLEAAEQVCEADLDTLEALVEQNLLRREAGRFHMLETIRESALERLENTSEADELLDRHARFYLDHAKRLDIDSGERDLPIKTRRALFEPERANSHAALEHFRRARDMVNEAELATTVLWIDWWWTPEEGRRWLGDTATYKDVPPAVRARVLWAASRVARYDGDLALDVELNEELLKLLRRLDAKQLVVRTLARLAVTSILRGDSTRARTALQEAHVVATEVGTEIVHAVVALGEAIVALYSEELDDAQLACERALDWFRQAGAPPGITSALSIAGTIGLLQARHDNAARSFRESLLTRKQWDALWDADSDLEGLAHVSAARGELTVAAVLLGAADSARERIRAVQGPIDAGLREQTQAAVQQTLDSEALQAALTEGRAMTTEAGVEYALANVD